MSMDCSTYRANVPSLQFCQVAMLCVGKTGQACVGGQLKGLLNFRNEEYICMEVEGAVASWLSMPASLGFHLAGRVAITNTLPLRYPLGLYKPTCLHVCNGVPASELSLHLLTYCSVQHLYVHTCSGQINISTDTEKGQVRDDCC